MDVQTSGALARIAARGLTSVARKPKMRRIPFLSLIGLPGSVPLAFFLACAVAVPGSSTLGQPAQQDQKAESEQAKRRQEEVEEKACGLKDVDHWAKTDKKQHPTPDPPPDKALIYVIRPLSMYQLMLQSKLAVDGQWMGVNRNGTYFFFTLDPGEHYFCSQVRNRSVLVLTVEAGRTYFLEQKLTEAKVVPLDALTGKKELEELHLSVFGVKK